MTASRIRSQLTASAMASATIISSMRFLLLRGGGTHSSTGSGGYCPGTMSYDVSSGSL